MQELERYEGLVKTTASQIVAGGVEMEFDDVAQLLRIKVWSAIQKFEPRRAAEGRRLNRPRDRRGRTPLDRWVFLVLANYRKDLERMPRRYVQSMEAFRESQGTGQHGERKTGLQDKFDAKYLCALDSRPSDDELDLPPDLTETERQVIALRLQGTLAPQIESELGLTRAQRVRVMRSLREKLGDLDPARKRQDDQTPPRPREEPPHVPFRHALAA